MQPGKSTDPPTTPGEQPKKQEMEGAAVGVLAGLGCAGYALIMVIVVVVILLIVWLIGAFT